MLRGQYTASYCTKNVDCESTSFVQYIRFIFIINHGIQITELQHSTYLIATCKLLKTATTF